MNNEKKLISISNLKTGIYLIKVNQNEDTITKKLVIN